MEADVWIDPDFSFANVSPGTYFLGAGSNTDNDSLICEVGEACGGYPVLSQLSPITVVDQDISGLEFVTRYLIRVPEPSSAVLGLVALATLASLARRRRR